MARIHIVIPVYNEECILEQSVERVYAWIKKHPEHDWYIVIADNGSTDKTLSIAQNLERKCHDRVIVLQISQKGRGLAQRTALMDSFAQIFVSMDADLSTDLIHLLEIVDLIVDDRVDIAYGSRKHPKSETNYRLSRAIASWGYLYMMRLVMGLKVSDAQCGFKAISSKAARDLVPLVRDNKGFFESELLLIAQKNNYRLKEVPVRWIENRDTRYKLLPTTIEALKFICRLRFSKIPKVK